ncbi:aspartic endopeptidase [Apiospora hydei]|uniref:Aspartic endopeptidase n=1 Tax=Apiospora hydei TaxID=1337664 RepID=A0ABR1XBI8_9PEZI
MDAIFSSQKNLKSYVYLLNRLGFQPTKPGPYRHVMRTDQYGLPAVKQALVGGRARQNRVLVKQTGGCLGTFGDAEREARLYESGIIDGTRRGWKKKLEKQQKQQKARLRESSSHPGWDSNSRPVPTKNPRARVTVSERGAPSQTGFFYLPFDLLLGQRGQASPSTKCSGGTTGPWAMATAVTSQNASSLGKSHEIGDIREGIPTSRLFREDESGRNNSSIMCPS